jgi:hypothetical protein
MNIALWLRRLSSHCALGLVFLLGLLTQPAGAAVLTWDNSGNGTAFDGSGSWTLTGSNWWNGAQDLLWTNAADIAEFGSGSGGSTPYAIALSGSTNAGGLIFQNQAYTISGSTLNLVGAAPSIVVNPPQRRHRRLDDHRHGRVHI